MTTNDFIRMQCIFCNNYKFIDFKIDKEPEYFECISCKYLRSIDYDNYDYHKSIDLSGLGLSLEELYYYSKNDINKIDIGDNLELNKIKSLYNYQLKILKENINIQRNNFNNCIRYNMVNIRNCIHCKIAIKGGPIELEICNDCYRIRKDLFVIKTEAKKQYFLKSTELVNIRHDIYRSKKINGSREYKLYYINDLIKKRNEKYNQTTIAKLIEKRDNKTIMKYKIMNERKKEIILECANMNLKINNNDFDDNFIFDSSIIKDYLLKGPKSKYKLNDIIEKITEDNFLQTKTNYFAYFLILLIDFDHKIRDSNKILKYIYSVFNNTSFKIIHLQEIKSDLKYIIFKYIVKNISIPIQKKILEDIIHYSKNIKDILSKFKENAIFYAINEINNNNDNKFIIPKKFIEFGNDIIKKYNLLQLNILSDELYNKYFKYILEYNPDFEEKIIKELDNYKKNNDIVNEPIELNLIKKNNNDNKNNNDEFVFLN
jgi:hypothetical protein